MNISTRHKGSALAGVAANLNCPSVTHVRKKRKCTDDSSAADTLGADIGLGVTEVASGLRLHADLGSRPAPVEKPLGLGSDFLDCGLRGSVGLFDRFPKPKATYAFAQEVAERRLAVSAAGLILHVRRCNLVAVRYSSGLGDYCSSDMSLNILQLKLFE